MRSLANTFANHVAAVSDEVVSRRGAFEVGRAISQHDDLKLIFRSQLTRIKASDLSDGFTLAAAPARWLVDVESTVVAVEVEQQFIGKQVGQGNVELLCHWVNKRVESARDQVDLLVLCP